MEDSDRAAYLDGLAPGADIDHRGTSFSETLLGSLLEALRDPATGQPHLGKALFGEARFFGNAWFHGARFSSTAWFDGAYFSGDAGFGEARFSGIAKFIGSHFSRTAKFDGARFSSSASFNGVRFIGDSGFGRTQFASVTRFVGAQFSSTAWFNGAQFCGDAAFDRAQFSATAWFDRTRFSGNVKFDRAQFSDTVTFGRAQCTGNAEFGEAQFSGIAGFDRAQFAGGAEFHKAHFSTTASFAEAHFSDYADFGETEFSATAGFTQAQFSGNAKFDAARFSGTAEFNEARFSGDARFAETRFALDTQFGPVICGRTVDLSGAVFEAPTTIEVAARHVACGRARWEATATVRLRYATVDLSYAVLSSPLAITTHPAAFTFADGRPADENLLPGPADVRLTSVRGVDAAHLVLTDIDLTDCIFSGAFHLDQLRLEGRTTFAPTPIGWHRSGLWPVRRTRRRTLAEEHHWRAMAAGQPAPTPGQSPSPRTWHTGRHHPDAALTPDPEDVAVLYRQLRKAFEDGKNEPGAADFYYGECEMRRHDRTGTPPGERHLLLGYWLLSGYGLRASRAFAWLLAAMSLSVLLLVGFGLPTHNPRATTTGTVHGSEITLSTDTPDPTLHEDFRQRMSWARAELAARVAVNSVVFRSSGQNLTTVGTYIEMTTRLLEPVLLALGVLAIRGRVKR
ncbi:hypothetical protein ADK70_37470 [Streptomyces rimosus subsp. pseudoverticillatus]|uniref:pentapeptide repeat-containing protein n=1 Tax=Streptomyces rimosus TaxID=1927 RepID=UPI0006B29561|nr:pentapeptide repeat-containing protein [Streptomyces rimosus]KOT77048.1 hypothetical protein ADK70_37470 [Streptomyces rimosus subsp. pseudoverticillatus]